ncbi:unnamed protein product [Effrenium voratum]|nr:unnamed protein product [Effrenium voratum]
MYQGRHMCWGDGTTFESCCVVSGDGCFETWGSLEQAAAEFCCSTPESVSAHGNHERLWEVQAAVTTKAALAVDCFRRLGGDCELHFVEEVARMEVGDPEHLRRWLARPHRWRAEPVDLWHAGLAMSEVVLHWRLQEMLGLYFGSGPNILGNIEFFNKMHSLLVKQLHLTIRELSQLRFLEELRRPWRPRGPPVHIALVASVGLPVFAAKAMATVRSALFFARRRPLHFHLFADGEGVAAVRAAWARLEPRLARRGTYEVHSDLQPFFQLLSGLLPQDCLGRSRKFGDSGWLRLLPHEVFKVRNFKRLIYVDAGDYVFLEDPALMLRHRRHFTSTQVAGGPLGGSIPVQVLDVDRMARVGWTDLLRRFVKQQVREVGPSMCDLGEGWISGALANEAVVWHNFDANWAIEPREFGGLQGSGGGMRDLWLQSPDVWRERVYPGVQDWTQLRVHCPRFSESFLTAAFLGEMPADKAAFIWAQHLAAENDASAVENRTLYQAHFTTVWNQMGIKCGSKILGLHFALNLKAVPWARRFLNFWAGSEAWGADVEDFEKRAMTRARDDPVARAARARLNATGGARQETGCTRGDG